MFCYPQFGIVKKGNSFIVPRHRDQRQAALPLIVAAITAHGFSTEKYGATFWETTKNSYNELLSQAAGVDGSVSDQVGAKNQLRKEIVKTHNAIINVLRATTPTPIKR